MALDEQQLPDTTRWILDSGSSHHFTNDKELLMEMENKPCSSRLPDGSLMDVSECGNIRLEMETNSAWTTVTLTDVYYAPNLPCNLLSYGLLEAKGCKLVYKDEKRYLQKGSACIAEVKKENNVLVVSTRSVSNLVNLVMSLEANTPPAQPHEDSLMNFHRRLGHLHFDSVIRLAKDPSSGIKINDFTRQICVTCAQGKQSKNLQSKKDTGANSPIDRIGGVIGSDLKGPLTPPDRNGNRYIINFIDYKSNYTRVFLAKKKNEAAKKFGHFVAFFERQFNC
jgi:hypothetical protein